MFAGPEELASYDLEIADAALIRVSLATECSYCHTPPAPRGINDGAALDEWLNLVTGGGTRPRPIGVTGDESKCFQCDSQIGPAIAIPDHILVPIINSVGLSESQREFLRTELVLPICGVCRFSPHARGETAPRIVARYTDFRFGGDRAAYEQSAAAAICRQIAGLIAAELRIQRSGHGTI